MTRQQTITDGSRRGRPLERKTIMLDPGQGGGQPLATALARRIAARLGGEETARHAASLGKRLAVRLSGDADGRTGRDRSAGPADLFLGLRFDRGDGSRHGTGAWIDRKHESPHRVVRAGSLQPVPEGPGDLGSRLRNLNHVDDAEFGSAIALTAFGVIRELDPAACLWSAHYSRLEHGEDYCPPDGVRMAAIDLLRDDRLGPVGNRCRACILQIEIADHPVAGRFAEGPEGRAAAERLAEAIARSLTVQA